MENNIKNFYDDDELKKYLFNLWETNEFITINEIKFNTVKYILAYDIASDNLKFTLKTIPTMIILFVHFYL
jgi:hypothetical protein